MARLVTITTHPSSTNVLMRGQLAYMRGRGLEVVAIASPGGQLDEVADREGVTVIGVPMARELEPFRDGVSLLHLYRTIRRLRPDVVNAGTNKAALLGMLAAWAARVPVRIYTLRGLRLETERGLKRRILRLAERLTAWCSTRIVCVSPSLRDRYLREGFAPPEKTVVLGSGSSNGVDPQRFQPAEGFADRTAALRDELGFPAGALVIGFVGRLVRDKGVVELVDAFEQLSTEFPEVRLLLLGEFEGGDPLSRNDRERIRGHRRIVAPGPVPDPAPYYPLMDVLAFPSYREGFPNVPLEAACAEMPAVGFEATGTVDAIEDGVTGTIVPCGDRQALASALGRYLADPELRRRHGKAGRERVLREFQQEPIWAALYDQYMQSLEGLHEQPPQRALT